ncbi:peptide-binding protein [Enterococcus faecium]|uniref:peptide-binding protein n=1 Tax=Enterococcus faecium TaxID=1352 RepID=UPI001D0C5A4E|nr:peptide-binding protein [Enterococcus faecium]UDP42659.1 peptide-binding protein [Enterococcus faecium UC7251]
MIVGNLGAQKEKRNDTPISAKKDIMGDKTDVRVRADLHHIIKIETAKNGGNVKEVMEIRLRSKLKSVLIVHYLKILYNRN